MSRVLLRLIITAAMVVLWPGVSAQAQTGNGTITVTIYPGPFQVSSETVTMEVRGQPQEVVSALVVDDSRGAVEAEGWQVQVSCTCEMIVPTALQLEVGQPVDSVHGLHFDPVSGIFKAEPGYGAGIYILRVEPQPDAEWTISIIEASAAP